MSAFLSAEVLTLLILESLLLFFLTLSFGLAMAIARKFDAAATTPLQYALEKRSYLISVIIKFALSIKIVIFLYFIFTLDKLSSVITGAMCAAGVVTASEYGTYLLILKLLDIFLFGFWIILNRLDMRNETSPYTRLKFRFFLFLFPLAAAEFLLFILYLDALDPSAIVSCCGALFSAANVSVIGEILAIPDSYTLSTFYLLFGLILLFATLKRYAALLISVLIFLPTAVIAIINIFSTYVYELPTHRCPFCILQKEYAYTGYLFYLFLFAGTFLLTAQSLALLKLGENPGLRKPGMWLVVLFVLWSGYYPLAYYLKNGVFL